jgi:hypothetical protein
MDESRGSRVRAKDTNGIANCNKIEILVMSWFWKVQLIPVGPDETIFITTFFIGPVMQFH